MAERENFPPINTAAFETIASLLAGALTDTSSAIERLSKLVKAGTLNEDGIAYFKNQLVAEQEAMKQLRVFRQWFVQTFAPKDHHGWGLRDALTTAQGGDQ